MEGDGLGLDVGGGDVGGDAPLDVGGDEGLGDEGLDGLADDLGGEEESVTCSRADLQDVLQQVSDGLMSVDDAVAKLASPAGDDLGVGDLPPIEGEGGDLGGADLGGEGDDLDMGGEAEKPSFMEERVSKIANLITEDPDVFTIARRNRK